MSTYNAKNYTEQGGDVTHIGGRLIIEDGGSVEGLSIPEDIETPEVPVLTNQAESEATTVAELVEDFNTLLAKLKIAGLMEADEDQSPAPEVN